MAAVEIPRDEQAFLEYVQSGGQVETTDWMPDDYRAKLIKFIEMHGNSELMGVLPEREWILRAPTLQRKLALTAKVQDEVGHAQLIYRVVEDLGKPRERCLEDLVTGKAKFHNVFHYPTKTWGDVGVIAWLVDAAAIISQKALLKCSYAPYARIMKKICWEESFHILHGRDVILTLMNGTDEQRELVQEAVTRWWGPLMQFHGNPIAAEDDPMFVWRIKSQGNEEARQQFLDGYVPQIWRSEEHTSELQSHVNLVCRLLLEKKKKKKKHTQKNVYRSVEHAHKTSIPTFVQLPQLHLQMILVSTALRAYACFLFLICSHSCMN